MRVLEGRDQHTEILTWLVKEPPVHGEMSACHGWDPSPMSPTAIGLMMGEPIWQSGSHGYNFRYQELLESE